MINKIKASTKQKGEYMKKKVLYISNIEVPYRTAFFNELSKKCDLTVLYERRKSSNRNSKWVASQKSNFKIEYLDGINIKNENSFSFKINGYIFSDYDVIILGCCNSIVQIYAMTIMKIFKKNYYINLDGEYFLEGSNIKSIIKRFFIKKAKGYLIAGEKSGNKLKQILKINNVYPYYFSSLTREDLEKNSKDFTSNNRGENILVIGQYFEYKGLDIALDVAARLPDVKFKIIGMSGRAEQFKELAISKKVNNVEIIPFLEKEKLNDEYKKCKLLLLTSRKECWGLVINEAASFGCPIIASKNAGAAIEFLEGKFDKYLVNINDVEEIVNKIKNYNNDLEYKKYLIDKSKKYTIEQSVKNFIDVINKG